MNPQSIVKVLTASLSVTFLVGLFLPYPHEPSFEMEWKNYVHQPNQITCGPTSALMVLREYGKTVDLETVSNAARTTWFTYEGRPIGMTAPDYLDYAISQFDLNTWIIHGSEHKLKYFVNRKRPPIVMVRSGKDTWHYVVVTGYTEDKIIAADPASGSRRNYSLENFMSAWAFETDLEGVRYSGSRWLNLLLRHIGIHPYMMLVPTQPL